MPKHITEFIMNETEEYKQMYKNYEQLESIILSYNSFEYSKNQLKFDSSEINNKEYRKCIDSHNKTMCELLLKQNKPVVLIDK